MRTTRPAGEDTAARDAQPDTLRGAAHMRLSTGQIRTEQSATTTVVRLTGDIDADVREDASRALAAALTGGRPVVVDTSALTFIDSSGIAFLIQCARSCAQVDLPFSLPDPPAHLATLIDVLGLATVLRPDGPTAAGPGPG